MSEFNIKKKDYDINLSLLRIYLSFLVVNSHCLKGKNIENKFILNLLLNNIHAPMFFIISFYFCHNLFVSKNITKIKQRFERILLPYFIWPIIIWILNNLINFFYKKQLILSFNDLIMQLVAGHCFMTVLWFQYNLIFTTLLMVIIILLFKNYSILILINLLNIAYFLQFSNINFILFSKYSYYIKYTFGRFIEILPYCITGYIMSSIKLIDILKKNILKSIYIIFSILYFTIKFNLFVKINGFRYQGISLYIISVSLFNIISIISRNNKSNNIIFIKMIKILSKHTSGIYYLHVPIKNYLQKYIIIIKNKTLFGSIIVYLLCFFISSIGTFLFKNTKLRHLFQ